MSKKNDVWAVNVRHGQSNPYDYEGWAHPYRITEKFSSFEEADAFCKRDRRGTGRSVSAPYLITEEPLKAEK